ncbi:MAG: Tm-1-like ATP-binding domain-containing protein [Planctomycetes bacterium]|nr:Tm-1-like ATP-binding domain-containing protein [Planctomycetota bacterium]
MPKTVAILGTLDTKGKEFAFIRALVARSGLGTLVIDAGVLGAPVFEPDVPRAEVAAAAGEDVGRLAAAGDRGRAVAAMASGAAALVRRLFDERRVDACIALGGSAGTTIGTAAMRALPLGVPKVMVSTLGSGDTRPYVGTRDILMLNSVVDIAGINRISRPILANAANAIAGMLLAPEPPAGEDRRLIAATMFGVTTPCVEAARRILEEAGYEVLVFHATGTGGRAMEELIRDGVFAGVLDITTTEWADEIAGGVLSAGPDRLRAAAETGTPQLVSTGACDMANFGPWESVPECFRGRNLYRHNPSITLMRTTAEENERIGAAIAERVGSARGPASILIPRRGVSAIDREGQPFHDPAADEALFRAIERGADPRLEVRSLDLHINDPAFAQEAAELLLAMLGGG